MKKFLSILLAVFMVFALVGCGSNETADEPAADDSTAGKIAVNVMSFTDEIPGFFTKFLELHPEYAEKYYMNDTIIATTDGLYQPALDEMLAANDENTPDVYGLEGAFVLKYTQGEGADFAATYKELGIDVDTELAASEIAPYTVDIGTRPTDKQLVALGYQATGGCFIYRRSIAKAVWGTDDPATVAEKIGAGTQSWDKFWEAAEDCKKAGYKIISGDGDMWHAVENSSDAGWINADGKLHIDAKREAFLDQSKKLVDNEYHNDTTDWTEGWFADMKMSGTALGFYGPAWLINYTIAPNCNTDGADDSTGDWAVCAPNVGFYWGGTWLAASKHVVGSEKEDIVRDFIKFVTLDCDDKSLQSFWANGTMVDGVVGTKDSVASGVVMANADGTMDFCGGQNVFEAFVPANTYANGKNATPYDESINSLWRSAVKTYAHGDCTREEAISSFKDSVASELGIEAE